MRENSDEALMVAFGDGSAEAFEVLYGRYRGPLYRYYTRQVSDPATANDLYQGCWEKVITARRRYREASPFKAWLFRIAHNHLVDHYRAARPVEPLDESNPGPGAALTAESDPAQTALDDERMHRFRLALAELPADQRETMLLRLESGLNVEEIGKIMGVGSETAKSRLRYATRKLKQALQS